jgi:hydrogenase expression/formation protein HypD
MSFMEVCGTHTVAIFRHGIRGLLPPEMRLLSGPGCPVCVTDQRDLDVAVALAGRKDVILTTFGDMMRVPASSSSLEREKGRGADIRLVYSVLDALAVAEANPEKKVVFLAVGFETTSPSIACAVVEAEGRDLRNFFILPCHKLIPPAMRVLVNSGDLRLDGFLCPGHVSAVIGSRPYEFLAREYGLSCVVAGFEPLDVLRALYQLVLQVAEGRSEVEIEYRRVVKPEGNPAALAMLHRVFREAPARWRGLGLIPGSGLALRPEFERFDAVRAIPVEVPDPEEPEGCLCGEILRGAKTPYDCGLFGTVCTPDHPVGPCMVSTEGTCSAYFKYGTQDS